MALSDDLLGRLVLSDGERVVFKSRRDKGSMGQEEIYSYDILDINGICKGSVTYTEHVNLRGLQSSYMLVQRDVGGKIVVDDRW